MKYRRNDTLIRQITDKLRKIRIQRSLTQEEVSFHTNLNIGRIESGKHSISITTLEILCDFYEISLEEFFKGFDCTL